MARSGKPVSEVKKPQDPLSPAYMEGPEETLLVGKAFSNFPVQKMIPKTELAELVSQFKKLVKSVKAKDIQDQELVNPAKMEKLTTWLDNVIRISFATLLDKKGYIQTQKLSALGWRGGVSVHKPEMIKSLTVSFIKVFLQEIIKDAFTAEKLKKTKNLQSHLSFVINFLGPKVREKVESKFAQYSFEMSKAYIDDIRNEFVKLLEKDRLPAEYEVVRHLMKLDAKLDIPLTDLAVYLDAEKSKCPPKGSLIKIINKYREILELSLPSAVKKVESPSSQSRPSFFSPKETGEEQSPVFKLIIKKV